MSTCYTPYDISINFPDTASLMAAFGLDAIQTGFGCFDNIPSSPYYYQAAFASQAGFINLLINRGFFTGCYPHVYYSPEAAKSLNALGNVTYNGVSMNRMEHRMRVEGITVGCFATGAVTHAPGEDPCTILENLAADGYSSGSPGTVAPIDGGFSDYDCEDGRLYGSGCLMPWTKEVTVDQVTPQNVNFTVTFKRDMRIIQWSQVSGNAWVDTYMDGVLVETSPHASGTDLGRVRQYDAAAGTHTFTFTTSGTGSGKAVRILFMALRELT